jgi:hypothetical protein
VPGQRFPGGFVEMDVSVAVWLVCSHERDARRGSRIGISSC